MSLKVIDADIINFLKLIFRYQFFDINCGRAIPLTLAWNNSKIDYCYLFVNFFISGYAENQRLRLYNSINPSIMEIDCVINPGKIIKW